MIKNRKNTKNIKIIRLSMLLLIFSLLCSACTEDKSNDADKEEREEQTEEEVEDQSEDQGEKESEDQTEDQSELQSEAELQESQSEEQAEVNSEELGSENTITSPTRITVAVDVLNVRSTAAKSGELVGKALLNEQFDYLDTTVDSENQTWYQIQLADGTIGWVAGWLCAVGDTQENKLLSVMNGKLDITPFGIGATLAEIRKEKPNIESEGYFMGGPYLSYTDFSYLADEKEKVMYVFYFGNEETNGVRKGFTFEEMQASLGIPDEILKPIEIDYVGELYQGDEMVCFYEEGNYRLVIIFTEINQGISSIGIE